MVQFYQCFDKNQESNRRYIHGITPKRVRTKEWWGPSPRLGDCATQKHRKGSELLADTVSNLAGPGIKPKTSRGGCKVFKKSKN